MEDQDKRQEKVGRFIIGPNWKSMGNCYCGPGPSCYYRNELMIDITQPLSELNSAGKGSNELEFEPDRLSVIEDLEPGETVLYLGSGRGFDCFMAAVKVGETGRVIGIDMSTEIIGKAREFAEINGYRNIEFRLGEIESLPVAGGEVDIIISNCMINLTTDKKRVLSEAYRVLKDGGRLALSEIIAANDIPVELMENLRPFNKNIEDILKLPAMISILNEIGFENINIRPKDNSREIISNWQPDYPDMEKYFWASIIMARKAWSRC